MKDSFLKSSEKPARNEDRLYFHYPQHLKTEKFISAIWEFELSYSASYSMKPLNMKMPRAIGYVREEGPFDRVGLGLLGTVQLQDFPTCLWDISE